ncbi:MAG: CesT family type III secretion system chaperone [Victivallaceae bacterium]
MLDKLISRIAAFLGITSSVELDSQGGYTLPFENEMKVRVYGNAENDIVLSMVLSYLDPKTDHSKLYYDMMVGNLFGKETGGSVLGLGENGSVLLIKRLTGIPSDDRFSRHLETFVNFAEAWKDEIATEKVQE